MPSKFDLNEYGFRPAKESDIPFVLDLVVDGAKEGHYLDTLLDAKQQKAFRAALENVIKIGGMARRTERGDEVINCKLFIYGKREDDQVGFLLVAEKTPGSSSEVLEFYKASIKKDRRRLGHGKNMVSLFVRNYPLPIKFFARCYPVSFEMISLLKGVGFEVLGKTGKGTLELGFQKQGMRNIE